MFQHSDVSTRLCRAFGRIRSMILFLKKQSTPYKEIKEYRRVANTWIWVIDLYIYLSNHWSLETDPIYN